MGRKKKKKIERRIKTFVSESTSILSKNSYFVSYFCLKDGKYNIGNCVVDLICNPNDEKRVLSVLDSKIKEEQGQSVVILYFKKLDAPNKDVVAPCECKCNVHEE